MESPHIVFLSAIGWLGLNTPKLRYELLLNPTKLIPI